MRCPVCSRKIEKWIFSNPADDLTRRSVKSRDIIEIRRMCPHCLSQWSRKFSRRNSLAFFLSCLAGSVALGMTLGQAIFNSRASLGIAAQMLSPWVGSFVAFFSWIISFVVGMEALHPFQLIDPTRLCSHCHSSITVSDAKFCPRCGTDQTTAMETAQIHDLPPIESRNRADIRFLEREPPKSCIVCKMTIGHSDEVIWCPHCSGTAHRDEFLEWLHVKGQCPACRQHVNERELRMVTMSTVNRNG